MKTFVLSQPQVVFVVRSCRACDHAIDTCAKPVGARAVSAETPFWIAGLINLYVQLLLTEPGRSSFLRRRLYHYGNTCWIVKDIRTPYSKAVSFSPWLLA